MKNLKTLEKSELRNIMGGGMDKDTTLQYCLDHIVTEDTGDADADYVIRDVQEDMCYSAWKRMTA